MHTLTFTPHGRIWRMWQTAGLAAALLGGWAHAQGQTQGETISGVLERGRLQSVLWTVSPESGDLIGQVFDNQSPAGNTILASCLPELVCEVQGASLSTPDEAQLSLQGFSEQPSGWWQIDAAQDAHMASNLSMAATELSTRFGQLRITEDQRLLLNQQAVMAPGAAPQATPPAPATSTPAPEAAAQASPDGPWWQQWRNRLLRIWQGLAEMIQADVQALRSWLGQRFPQLAGEPASAATAAENLPEQPAATQTAETPPRGLQAIQGNSQLHIVEHVALEKHDVVLLQNTGGSACPALFRFIRLSAKGAEATEEFGTCSDLASLRPAPAPFGPEDMLLILPGQHANGLPVLSQYVYANARLQELPAH